MEKNGRVRVRVHVRALCGGLTSLDGCEGDRKEGEGEGDGRW